ncbi:MAG: exo-beta-N-acetylmuramidase NamZ domain-containing protein, partial [Gammaproteobacteria bacterium]
LSANFLLVWSLLTSLPGLSAEQRKVELGIDVLLAPGSPYLELVAGKRVGLITNPSGVDGDLVPTVDRLAGDSRLSLIRLFGPEHGIRGEVPAGETIADGRDPRTGVAVVSLYGKEKRPSKTALAGVEVILFDIQDIGSRTYTYISTLGEALHACAATRIPLVVLDRPNPLGGLNFEGTLVEDRFRSFIGWGPVPVTHGMTLGEVGRYFNDQLGIGCDLHVVPMRGWRRSMSWDDTGLIWSITSPHVPSVTQAYLYTTTGMVASTVKDINEGVGSTMPFEIIGATFLDAARLEESLQALRLPGVLFQAIHYKPFYGKYRDAPMQGVRLRITHPSAYRPLRTAVAILSTLRRLYPERIVFREDRAIGTHWGSLSLRQQLEAGMDIAAIENSWLSNTKEFAIARQRAMLYD